MSATRLRKPMRQSWPMLIAALACAMSVSLSAQSAEDHEKPAPRESGPQARALFAAGVASGLLSHEAGHLLFDVVFDADPDLRRVEFGGVPFFAITHRGDLSRRREYTISSAGFWTEHALSEWVLSAHPHLREQRRPYLKGLLAWQLLSSAVYTVAALGKIGPPERDTRGMAASLDVSERWIGVLLVVPAACDAWRYFDPDARWPRWLSRTVKVGLVLAAMAVRG